MSYFNELSTLVISYHVMVLVSISEDANKKEVAGMIISSCLYTNWSINFIVLVLIFLTSKIQKVKWYFKKKRLMKEREAIMKKK